MKCSKYCENMGRRRRFPPNFFLSLGMYGEENMNPSEEAQMDLLHMTLSDEEEDLVPYSMPGR